MILLGVSLGAAAAAGIRWMPPKEEPSTSIVTDLPAVEPASPDARIAMADREEPAARMRDVMRQPLPAPADIAAHIMSTSADVPAPATTAASMVEPSTTEPVVVAVARVPRARPDEPMFTGSIARPLADPCSALAELPYPMEVHCSDGRIVINAAPAPLPPYPVANDPLGQLLSGEYPLYIPQQ